MMAYGPGMMGGLPMMNMMGMMTPGMIDHVEGRIAFLRTELKITDAQMGPFNDFAAALRANAKNLGEVRTSMMAMMGRGQRQAQTLPQRLDAEERWLAARLEGTRSLKSGFTKLYAVLSDEQKRTVDELFVSGMGMTAMMPALVREGSP